MRDTAYIKTKPSKVEFLLSDSEVSPKIRIFSNEKMLDCIIEQGGASIIISIEDIDWLRQALDDIKELSKMQTP